MSAPETARLADLPSRTFAAVLFDLDGTLVDSTAAVGRSWLRWTEEFGVDPVRLQGFHGVPASGVVRGLLAEDRWGAAAARIEDLEVGDTEGITLLPGAAEALAAVVGGGGHAAVVTSCTRPLYAARAVATGLVTPEVSVTADEVEHGKPAPDPYLLGARRLGVDPADCLVVEDAPNGLRSAKEAGCATLAVVSTSTRDELERSGLADAVVGGLADVAFSVEEGGRIRVRPTDG